jgi:hypothetical protein
MVSIYRAQNSIVRFLEARCRTELVCEQIRYATDLSWNFEESQLELRNFDTDHFTGNLAR